MATKKPRKKSTRTSGPKPSKKRQQSIPGTESPKAIADIDDAAPDYLDAKDSRVLASNRETETREVLIAALKKHQKRLPTDKNGQPYYVYVDGERRERITLCPKDATATVRVKPLKADEPAPGDRVG